MKCPFCGTEDTGVIDSRPSDDGLSIRRRRECKECKKRFTTYEKQDTMPLLVIKKDGNREAYDRSKVEKGILRSCEKRPISANTINKMLDDIESKLYAMEKYEVQSYEIGEIVMQVLQKIDDVAYIRFASVYRNFKDVNTFIDEVAKISKR
ncbi:MAG: transcriptional regulator NrdR [Eubacteriales bacterium]|nr:transcriptional regulator NrdR [Eubacteriales bacterium]